MATIPKKIIERYKKTVSKFQRILETAQNHDINEADTVSIIKDVLAEVFGFEKFLEITSEYAIHGKYCDLAIKIKDKIQFLIEVKAIGLNLKDHHLHQAVNYGANKGAQWIVLTNGIWWDLYKIRFERPISYDLVSSINFLELNSKKSDDQEKLFLLSKEGLSKSVRDDYYERMKTVNRFVIGALILSEPMVSSIRRDLRKLSSSIKVENTEIEKILRNEVLKRDVIEGDDASKATKLVKNKILGKATKHSNISKPKEMASAKEPKISLSDQSPKEGKEQA
jgi:predicted type IV restriction endonuclease